VPGTPTVQLNGHPVFLGPRDAAGAATPTSHTVTLNGNALLRYLVRRVDAISLPTVPAPQAPRGTRHVVVDDVNYHIGDFATIRNLTLTSGPVAVPPGAYGDFTAQEGSGFVLGVAGATEPAVYELQRLTLQGAATLEVVGPVILRLANGITVAGALSSAGHPKWLTLELAHGGVTLNGKATLYGEVVAPNGTVIINGNATLHGRVAADRLTLNGNALLDDSL
jgi:hypothetical protein